MKSKERPGRVCILTQYFPPELGAPQGRLSEFGKLLGEKGWEVDVLTANPNYPRGKTFPGYSKVFPCSETLMGMNVLRVPLVPFNQGFLGRLVCYNSFAVSATLWGVLRCRRPTVLFVETPPLFIGLAALSLSAMWRCPYVLNVSDLWVDCAVEMGFLKRDSILRRAASSFESFLCRHSIGITGQSGEIVRVLSERTKETRTELITNGVDPQKFRPEKADPEARQLMGDEDGPVFMYAGLMGLAQGLDQILDLAASLPPDVSGRFVLVGSGPAREHLEKRVALENIARVKILPEQPRDRMPALLASADCAVISLSGTMPGAVPSKIYEAMASALPILLIASGEPAKRVADAEAGVTAIPGNSESIRSAFQALVSDRELRIRCGQAGRRAAETTYNRTLVAERLHAFLLSIQ